MHTPGSPDAGPVPRMLVGRVTLTAWERLLPRSSSDFSLLTNVGRVWKLLEEPCVYEGLWLPLPLISGPPSGKGAREAFGTPGRSKPGSEGPFASGAKAMEFA